MHSTSSFEMSPSPLPRGSVHIPPCPTRFSFLLSFRPSIEDRQVCRKRGSASSVDTAPAEWNPRNNARKLLAAVRGRCPGERLQGVVGAIYFVCFARFLADPQRPWDPPPFPVLTCVCARAHTAASCVPRQLLCSPRHFGRGA